MRDFLHIIFKSYEVSDDSFWHADAFTIWHLIYAIIIIGSIVCAAIVLSKASEKTKKRVLDILPLVVIGLYIFDLFVRPIAGLEFVDGADFQQSINGYLDKLPFHICTAMGIACVFAQHCKKLKKLKGSFVILSIVGPLMYLTYPSGVFHDYFPFCYNTIQTMIFHGALMAWGVLSITTGQVKVSIKNWYKTLAIQGVLFGWGLFGNIMFSDMSTPETWINSGYDWFFIKRGAWVVPGTHGTLAFAIYAPIAVFAAIYLIVIGIYGLAHLGYYIAGRFNKNKATKIEAEAKEAANV